MITMFGKKDDINNVLRHGDIIDKETRNSKISMELEEKYHFLEFEEREFFKCIHEDDDDFDRIPEDSRTCDEEIEIIPGQNEYFCLQCKRKIHIDDKNFRFKKYRVKIAEKNIKEFVRNTLKKSGLTYLRENDLTFGQQKFKVFKFKYNATEFGVAVINKDPDTNLLDWIGIYNYPILFVLFDSAAFSAPRILEGSMLPSLDLGSLLTLDGKKRNKEVLRLVRKCILRTKMKAQSSSAKAIEKLKEGEIDYFSYEQCIYVLLKSMVDSVDKFGNSYIGKGLPDGFFTIDPLKEEEYGFYVYDCKFTQSRRELAAADYRAIYDYISSFRTSPVVTQSNFRDIDGFIIFSHNLKSTHLEKTYRHICSRSERDKPDNPWKGKLIYFETGSLILLAELLAEKREEIEQRRIFFYDYLNLFLHNEDLHRNSGIEEKGIIQISEDDIRNMVESILQRSPDEKRISAKALVSDLEERGLI